MTNFIKRGLAISRTLLFRYFLTQADKLLNNQNERETQLKAANQHLDEFNEKFIHYRERVSVVQLIKDIIRMIKAVASGQYKELPRKAVLLMSAALLYFISPIDILPDFIPLTGFIDDVSLLLWLGKTLRNERNRFVTWENAAHEQEFGEDFRDDFPATKSSK